LKSATGLNIHSTYRPINAPTAMISARALYVDKCHMESTKKLGSWHA
jgi:hypothetical protein